MRSVEKPRLDAAARWCADPAHHDDAARILSQPTYLGVHAERIARGLNGRLLAGPNEPVTVDGFFVPHAGAANLPARRHALWYYAQMVRWGQAVPSAEAATAAAATYRPELYRAALPDVPAADGEADRFFDGVPFDPRDLDGYIAAQAKINS